MTPDEFTAAVIEAIKYARGDAEVEHSETDALMEKVLTDLGYGEGIALIQKLERWYA